MKIQAESIHYFELNEKIRSAQEKNIEIYNCSGQRYIASGLSGKSIDIWGTPGNALGAYLDGANISVYGNVQDAVGDTMNDGLIAIHGLSGDATGYAMRGGRIYVKGNAGYRAGIHMKEYKEKRPVLIIGGSAGSFLGEYQAGGTIIVLGLNSNENVPVGYFCGTGMHGGEIYIRSKEIPKDLPQQVKASKADNLEKIDFYLNEFCDIFNIDKDMVLSEQFYVLTPNSKSPYRALYTYN